MGIEQDYEDYMDYDRMPPPPHESTEEIPWKELLIGLGNLRTKVLENRRQIIDNRAETVGCFADVWDNLTNMREALSLPTYPRKKKRLATFSPPSGDPTINPEAAELQAIIKRSKKEHEERIRA